MACGGVCVLDPRADCGTGLLCDFFLSSNASHLENEKCLRTACRCSLLRGFNQVSTGLARSLARVAVANRTGLGEVRTLGTRTSSCSLVGESDSQERETSSREEKSNRNTNRISGTHAPYTGLASRTHWSSHSLSDDRITPSWAARRLHPRPHCATSGAMPRCRRGAAGSR